MVGVIPVEWKTALGSWSKDKFKKKHLYWVFVSKSTDYLCVGWVWLQVPIGKEGLAVSNYLPLIKTF